MARRLRLAGGGRRSRPTPSWRPGLYEIELRTGDGPQDVSQAFVVVRHPGPGPSCRRCCTWHQHLAGVQPVGRQVPLQRRHRGVVPAADRGRLHHRARSTTTDTTAASPTSVTTTPSTTASRSISPNTISRCGRRRADGSTGNAASPSGPSAKGIELDYAVDADLDADPSVLDGRAAAAHRRSQRVLVVGDARHGRPLRRGRRQLRRSCPATRASGRCATPPNTASMICFKGSARSADPVARHGRAAHLTSCWSDPLIGRPETQTIGLSFTRGGYYLVGEAVPRGSRWLHRAASRIIGPSPAPASATATRSVRTATVVGYEVDGCALATRRRPCRSRPARTAPRTRSRCWPLAPAHLISITDRALRGARCRCGRASTRPATWSACRRSCSATPRPRTQPASRTATP